VNITENALKTLLQKNPDIRTQDDVLQREPMTPAARTWLAADRKKLEDRFLAWWKSIGGPELAREYRFAPQRRFRADFCHMASKTIVEIDGGLHISGAHNSQRTYAYQQERDRIARELGYEVMRLGTGFTLEQVEDALDTVVRRSPR